MLEVFMLIVVLSLLGILGVLYDISLNVRASREKLEQSVSLGMVLKTDGDHHHGIRLKQVTAFSIWCYEDGTWTLMGQCGQSGCDCGPPPPKPGSYEGQVVRKECAAKPD